MKVPKGTKWHHRKRGTDYRVTGEVRLQFSEITPKDGDMWTLYLGEDGVYSARPPEEFLDGRFLEVK